MWQAKHSSPKDAAGMLHSCPPGEDSTHYTKIHSRLFICSIQTTDITVHTAHTFLPLTHSVFKLQAEDRFSVHLPWRALTVPQMNHSCGLNDTSQTWEVLAVSGTFMASHSSFMKVNRCIGHRGGESSEGEKKEQGEGARWKKLSETIVMSIN